MTLNLTQINWGYMMGTTMTIISFLASIGYAYKHDWKHVVYWILAGGMTAVVTWWF